MPEIPRLSGKEVVLLLQKNGFAIRRISGSHYILRKPEGGSIVTVPVHGNQTLPIGTLKSILKQVGLL